MQIPTYLFEQMRYREFDVDRLYTCAPQLLLSHQTWFFVLVDGSNSVKGVLWATTEPVQNVLIVNMLSVDEEYQGGAVVRITDFLMERIKTTTLERKIFWINKRYKALSRSGWKNTGRVMMEFSQER